MWYRLYEYDAGLTHFINSFSNKNIICDEIVMLVTSLGIPLMVLAVAGQWWSRSNRFRTRHALLTAGFSFLLALTLNQIIIFFVHRVRPYNFDITHLLGSPSLDSSFPSDHASAAYAIAFAFLLCSRIRQGWLFFICASAISLSRVYICTHYITDVFGGMLTAFVAAFIVHTTYRFDSSLNQRIIRFF